MFKQKKIKGSLKYWDKSLFAAVLEDDGSQEMLKRVAQTFLPFMDQHKSSIFPDVKGQTDLVV